MSPDTDSLEVTQDTPVENSLVVDTPPTEEQQKQTHRSLVSKAAEAELKELLVQEMTLRKQISEAKTNTKKTFLKKKLQKVDRKAKEMIYAIQRLNQQRP